MAAREGAVNAKRAGLCQLRDLLVTTPEPLRAELRSLTRARLLACLAATRPQRRTDRAARRAARAPLRRSPRATADRRGASLAREIKTLTEKLAPQLLAQPGVGPLLAAQVVLSWSHKGRSEARQRSPGSPASPRSPPPPGRTIRYRLDRSGDRQLNRALHRSSSPAAGPPAHDRLHRTAHQRRQDTARGQPLPQALPRPQPLPAPRERSATGRLTNIEASLAQPSLVAFDG